MTKAALIDLALDEINDLIVQSFIKNDEMNQIFRSNPADIATAITKNDDLYKIYHSIHDKMNEIRDLVHPEISD